MNLFNRIRDVANAPARPESTLGPGDTLPANSSFGSRISAGSNAAMNRASEVYRKNPKMVGGLALLASAMLLNRMKSR